MIVPQILAFLRGGAGAVCGTSRHGPIRENLWTRILLLLLPIRVLRAIRGQIRLRFIFSVSSVVSVRKIGLAIGHGFAKLFPGNRKPKIQNRKSRIAPYPPQPNPPTRPDDGPPPIPLAAWAVAVLAYPLWLLVTHFATMGADALNTLVTLPDIIVQGRCGCVSR